MSHGLILEIPIDKILVLYTEFTWECVVNSHVEYSRSRSFRILSKAGHVSFNERYISLCLFEISKK